MNTFEEKREEAKLAVETDYWKKMNQAQITEMMEERRRLREEERRERRKAQVEKVFINDVGIPEVCTLNVASGEISRKFSNMQYPQITEIVCADDPRKKLYVFETIIYLERKWVVLDPKKCGNATYLLRALSSIGVMVLVNRLPVRKAYALQLIELLCAVPEKRVILPEKNGWYQIDGKLKFYSGNFTWGYIESCMVK